MKCPELSTSSINYPVWRDTQTVIQKVYLCTLSPLKTEVCADFGFCKTEVRTALGSFFPTPPTKKCELVSVFCPAGLVVVPCGARFFFLWIGAELV